MKRLLRHIALVLALIMIFCAPTAAVSELRISQPSDSSTLIPTYDAAYLLSGTSNRLFIDRVYPDQISVVLTLDYTVSSYALFGDRAAVLCEDVPNDQLIAFWYDIDSDNLWSAVLAGCSPGAQDYFGFDGDTLYLVDPKRNTVILCYDTDGSRVSRIDLGRSISQVITSPGGVTYAIAGGSLYEIIGSRMHPVSNHFVSVPVRFVAEDVMADNTGVLYRVNGSSAYAYSGYPSPASMIGNRIVYAEGSVLYAADAGRDADRRRTFENTICDICAVDGQIVAMRYDGQTVISTLCEDDLDRIPRDDANDEDNYPDLYDDSRFDFDAYVCTVPANTTVASLKHIIKDAGYSSRFQLDGAEVTSGKLKTGMTVSFGRYTFEICVKGDLTGEGNVNSRDMDLAMDVLLDVCYVSGVYFDAGDINDDGILDTMDLILLLDIIKGK